MDITESFDVPNQYTQKKIRNIKRPLAEELRFQLITLLEGWTRTGLVYHWSCTTVITVTSDNIVFMLKLGYVTDGIMRM